MERTSRCRILLIAVLAAAPLATGCATPDGAGDIDQLEAWCASGEEFLEVAGVFHEEPSMIDEDELAEALERGEVFFATAPAEIRPQLDVLQDPHSGAGPDEINAASQDVSDFLEANCDGIDPSFFETNP